MPEPHPISAFISRQEAKDRGLKHYFTGKPCISGHIDIRDVVSAKCRTCRLMARTREYERNKDRYSEYGKRYRVVNAEKRKESGKNYRERNSQQIKAKKREYYLRNKESINNKTKFYSESNKDRIAKYQKSYRTKNEEALKKSKARYRAENKENIKAKKRQEYKDNRDKYLARVRAWMLENPEKRRQNALNWWRNHPEAAHARRNAEGSFTADDIARIRNAQKNRCAICRCILINRPRFIHIDHIVAVTKGGTNWPKNLQLLCQSCNGSKYNHDPIEFMQSLGYLL